MFSRPSRRLFTREIVLRFPGARRVCERNCARYGLTDEKTHLFSPRVYEITFAQTEARIKSHTGCRKKAREGGRKERNAIGNFFSHPTETVIVYEP